MLDALGQNLQIRRVLRDQNNVRASVGRAERNVTRMPPHDLDDGNAPMAFRRGANPVNTRGRHKDRRGIARSGVVDNMIEVESGIGRHAFVAKALRGLRILRPHPFIRFIGVIEAKVVIDRLRREHDRQSFHQRLQAIERAIAADADQPFQAQLADAGVNQVQLLLFVWIDIVSRRPDECAAPGRFQFGNGLEKGVEMDVRDLGIKQGIEPLDQAIKLYLQMVCPHHRAVNGSVKGRGIAAGGQNANPFHAFGFYPKSGGGKSNFPNKSLSHCGLNC